MTMPCDCCPSVDAACGTGEVAFSQVLVLNGAPVGNMNSTIDGTAGADLSGFSPPVSEPTLIANPTWGFDYVFAGGPVSNLIRLRWFNGGGGVLTDQDGFGLVTVTFLDAALAPIGAPVLWGLGPPVGNNNVTRELNFTPLNGVARVRFNNFHKQNVAVFGAGAPLLRQVEAFVDGPVFPCRRPNGNLEWYDLLGNLVPTNLVHIC